MSYKGTSYKDKGSECVITYLSTRTQWEGDCLVYTNKLTPYLIITLGENNA